MKTSIEIDAGTKTFASSLLSELIAALRRCHPGDLLAASKIERQVTDELGVDWQRYNAEVGSK